jgi:hypothetical protein
MRAVPLGFNTRYISFRTFTGCVKFFMPTSRR